MTEPKGTAQDFQEQLEPPVDRDAGPQQVAHPPYMLIWGVLAVLMLGKVGVALIGLPKSVSIALLVLISLVSALLVALYYMHLRFEPRRLWILALVPFPLIAILILVVLMEY